jgi:regulator of sigma E protease
VLLANKEALVMAGDLFMAALAASDAVLLPIDSEHNAVFQCLPQDARPAGSDLRHKGVRRIVLTASGGPFREWPVDALHAVTPEQACKHPNWSMGRKISVDSANEPRPKSLAEAGDFRKGDLVMAVDGKATPTLGAVMLALVDRAMTGEAIEVEVLDADDRTRIRTLDTRESQGLADPAQVFERVGLVPWQPVLPAVIGQVMRDGAAERAGLRPGDRIVLADGKPIADWRQWREVIERHPSQAFSARIEREGVERSLELIPDAREDERGQRVGFIGAVADMPEDLARNLRVVVRYGPLDAVGAAIGKTWDISLLTLRMLGRMLVGRASLDNLSGPLTIARFAGQAASAGLIAFVSLLALVSISLGVLNLLPVPVLDGGHLLYYLIELIKGSPLSETVQNLGQQVGIAVLLLLMGLALFNDFSRIIG